MRIGFHANNVCLADGTPTGGTVVGTGFTIAWQNGALGRHTDLCTDHRAHLAKSWALSGGNPDGCPDFPCLHDCSRDKPTGAFVEDVIDAARQRLAFFQESPFACDENRVALNCLNEALRALDARTSRREHAGIEGTHAEDKS